MEGKLNVYMDIYKSMLKARFIDELEREYTNRGEAFFHVSGAGHEAAAALAPHLIKDDWLHCHYRDKGLLVARGVGVDEFLYSHFTKDGSASKGRQMSGFVHDAKHNCLSVVTPVGNHALQAAGIASVVKDKPGSPIVYCGIGDGSTQQGEFLESVAQAVRDNLPVLYLIQNNDYAISTKTKGRTIFSRPDGTAESFYDIPFIEIDGTDVLAAYETFERVVSQMRKDRKPVFVVMHVERLMSHTNADDQRVYRSPDEIEDGIKKRDPVSKLENYLIGEGVDKDELFAARDTMNSDIRALAKKVQVSHEPDASYEVSKPLPKRLVDRKNEYRGTDEGDQYTMIEAIRETLDARLSADQRVCLFGEDIEDPKGDVFGVTRGLTAKYPGRIENSPLTESTILGVSIGRALAGKRPVAFLQFADFMPLSFNQIFSELSTIYWRTNGDYNTPVIIMVSCGGYKPGLGPFHAASLESITAHIPGIDVCLPHTAGDAAGMLNAAFESERPTVFFYPKNCLNLRDRSTSRDVARQLIPVGKARVVREGSDLSFIAWGNTVLLCEKAADTLSQHDVSCEIIDLRSLAPWDRDAAIDTARKTGRVIIVHEDNHTNGFGAEVASTIIEETDTPVSVRRVTREDVHVPCNFVNQLEVLPSYKRTLETAVKLLHGKISWEEEESTDEEGLFTIEAIGSSPADESIIVIEWKIKEGDTITEGDLLAELEADKAAVDLVSPVTGVVATLLQEEQDMVKVGTPLVKVKTSEQAIIKPVTQEKPGIPVISLDMKKTGEIDKAQNGGDSAATGPIGIAGVAKAVGSHRVSNEDISAVCTQWSPKDIVKRTGIHSRMRLDSGESALSLGVLACRNLFKDLNITLQDIDCIICSSGSRPLETPSLACLIQAELAADVEKPRDIPAYDISAACSGYLYALQQAYDYLTNKPDHKILVITSETLSEKTDPADPSTAPIFGDAATASLVVGSANQSMISSRIFRPVVSSMGENTGILTVPSKTEERIVMDGPKVFLAAVRRMIEMLQRACDEVQLAVSDLSLVIPHQANQRIINGIAQKIKFSKDKVYSNIKSYGNTSSSSIPLCFTEVLDDVKKGEYIGLSAFGSGFTFGGAVIQKM